MVKRFVTIVVVCLSLAGAAGAVPQYKVVILRYGWPVGAWGVSGGQQAGVVGWHAALWSGTADSYVDLNPTGFDATAAYGISGSQQVGYGVGTITGSADHAMLWFGTAASYVDLNPVGFYESWAYGVSNGKQVGYGYDNSSNRASIDYDAATPGVKVANYTFDDNGNQVTLTDDNSHVTTWAYTARDLPASIT